jgi:formate dehydrogenase accessory protein FdhD
MVEATKGVKGVVIDDGARSSVWVTVPTVSYYDLYVNGERIDELRAMPFGLKELAIGYLLSNAYVEDPQIIDSVTVTADRIDVSADSEFDFRYQYYKEKGIKPIDSIKLEKITSNYQVSYSKILQKLGMARERAVLSSEIPGTTFAFVSDYNGLFYIAEDVYPEAAFYKAIGKAVSQNFDFRRSFVFVQDVLTPELLVFSAYIGVPIVGTMRGAPSLTVSLAEHVSGQTVFLEDAGTITVLSNPQRII